MIYTTYILVHPRTQHLQNVLTLEDYHQIQALLEFCLQRQQFQHDFLHQQQHQNREQARLIQALHNNKLLQLDYRRQRTAQIQRLMRQHQHQLDQYDRAHLLAALEKQRAQQCFRRFCQQHSQSQDSTTHEQPASYITHEQAKNEMPQQQQQPIQVPAPAQIQLDTEPPPPPTPSTAKNDMGATGATAKQVVGQQQEGDDLDQQESDDEQQVDDAYERYQAQQLEDLLKHIFEKNTKSQHQQQAAANNDEDDDEFVYAPYSYQQEDPEDEQTMAELLPILNEQRGNSDDDRGRPSTPPIPPKSMMAQQQQQQSQPMESTTSTAETDKEDDDDDGGAFLPDNVLPLQDVVDDLVRIPTPAVQQQQQQQQQQPLPPKEATQPPVHDDDNDNKERAEKLSKLAVIEQTLDRLATANQTDGTAHLPLQYQVNDQGGLVLDGNTPNNHKFLMLEDDIIRCMLQLDQILSEGDPVVRDRRRHIVKKAEQLLEPLDQHKQAEWTKETKRQQQQQQQQQQQVLGADGKMKKKHHRRHGKRKVRVPVTA